MILDYLLTFSQAQSVGVAQATVPGTNVVDLGIASGIPSSANGGGARDMGIGDNPALKLLVQVGTTITSGGALTLQVALQGAVDDGTGAPAAYSTYWLSPAYALATLNAGSRLYDMDFPRPPDGIAMPRFVRIAYIIAGADPTGGTIGYAGIVLDRDDQPYNGVDNSVQGGYRAGLNVAN